MTRALVMSLLAWSLQCGVARSQEPSPPPKMPMEFCPGSKGDWTVAFFSNGDNSLEGSIVNDMNEASRVGSSALEDMQNGHGLHLLMLIDARDGQLGGAGYVLRIPEVHGRPLLSRRLDQGQVVGARSFKSPDLDMAAGPTLTAFLDYAYQCFPADHYALIINGHGFGSRGAQDRAGPGSGDTHAEPMPTDARAFGSDDSAPGDVMYVEEVVSAIAEVLQKRAIPSLDLVGLDACLMSSVEVGYAFERVARVMVASEDLEGGSGWDHSGWLAALKTNQPAKGEDAAKLIVDDYETGIPHGYPEGDANAENWVAQRTLASVSLQDAPAHCVGFAKLTSALDYAGRLLAKPNVLAKLSDESLQQCPRFGVPGFKPSADLGCIVNRLLELLTPSSAATDDARKALLDVQAALSNHCVILANSIGDDWSGANAITGMSVFLPRDRASDTVRKSALVKAVLYPKQVDFPVRFFETGWGDLVRALFDSGR